MTTDHALDLIRAQQERAIRERLRLAFRHGRNARSATGRCPACTERTTA